MTAHAAVCGRTSAFGFNSTRLPTFEGDESCHILQKGILGY